MQKALTIAKQKLLSPFRLDEGHLNRVLSQLMGPNVDDGDVYMSSARCLFMLLLFTMMEYWRGG